MFGLAIGSVASGAGKTTLTLGLLGALRRRGLAVQPYKVGPDYIDPSQHTQVAGRPSRNLDSWMLPEAGLRELFARAAASADVVVVEGVMGLFDGRTGEGEAGSTAHVAKLLDLPLLLVVDAARSGRSVAATVAGCGAVDPAVRIIGVVLNNVASDRHAEIGREAIEGLAGLPVLGCLPRDGDLKQDERYLGLVPSAERRLAPSLVERASAWVAERIDLDRLLSLSRVPLPRAEPSGLFPDQPAPSRARLAVAQDEAFSFYYQDSLDLLAAWGAEIVPFSPLHDAALPDGIGGVYLGGGFPELFAEGLAANAPMLRSVRGAARAGLPIYGECGGLMYLQEAIVDADGRRHSMAGLLPGESTLVGRRLTLGYREVRALRDSPILPAGGRTRGHEFHWSRYAPPAPESAAYEIEDGSGRLEGIAAGNVLGSYVHLHLGARAGLAPRLVNACARVAEAKEARPSRSRSALTPRPLPTEEALTIPPGSPPDSRPAVPWPPRGANIGCADIPCLPQVADIPLIPTAPRPPLPAAGEGVSEAPGPGRRLAALGLPPDEIEALSRRQIEALLGDRLPVDEPARTLVTRLVYAGGDPSLAGRVEIVGDAITAAAAALGRGAGLIVDVGMLAAGISRPSLSQLGVPLHVAIQAPGLDAVANRHGITRSAAGMLALADRLEGSVVAIGNAPTALLALLDLAAEHGIRPAAVVGMPVGFVAAEESKEMLRSSGLPCILVRGTRGGSGLAAATVNVLLKLALAACPAAFERS